MIVLPNDGLVTSSTPFAFGGIEGGTLSVLALSPPRRYSDQGPWLLNYAPESKLGRLKCGRGDFFAGSNGETDMVNSHGRFVWYELMTTDIETAKAFYANVVGWGTRDSSMPGLAYSLFTVGDAPSR